MISNHQEITVALFYLGCREHSELLNLVVFPTFKFEDHSDSTKGTLVNKDNVPEVGIGGIKSIFHTEFKYIYRITASRKDFERHFIYHSLLTSLFVARHCRCPAAKNPGRRALSAASA